MILTGIGEILVNPVIYSYAFDTAPERLRSIVQSLNLVAGGAISNAITASFAPLVPQNFNEGNISWYFLANIAVASICLGVYWLVAQPEVKPRKSVKDPELGGPPVDEESTVSSLEEE